MCAPTSNTFVVGTGNGFDNTYKGLSGVDEYDTCNIIMFSGSYFEKLATMSLGQHKPEKYLILKVKDT